MSDRHLTIRVKLPDHYADAPDGVAFDDFCDFCNLHLWPQWEVELVDDRIDELESELRKALDFAHTAARKFLAARRGNIGGRVRFGLSGDRLVSLDELVEMLRSPTLDDLANRASF